MQKDCKLHSMFEDGHFDEEGEYDLAEMDDGMAVTCRAAPYKNSQGEVAGFMATTRSMAPVTAGRSASEQSESPPKISHYVNITEPDVSAEALDASLPVRLPRRGVSRTRH